MSLNEMVISQSSAKGPCRTHNENIRLHTERTPCRVEDQWCGLMKGGWCSWWLGRKKKGQKGRDLWCWLSNTLSAVPVLWLSQSEVTQIYIRKGSCCCCICCFTPINTTMLFFFPFKILLNHLSDHFVYCHLVWIWYIYSKANFKSPEGEDTQQRATVLQSCGTMWSLAHPLS